VGKVVLYSSVLVDGFGSVEAQHLLADPDAVIRGNRVLHLRCRVRR